MKKPIYLDYAATTPVDPRVAKLLSQYLTSDGCFGNASSITHNYGLSANQAVEIARKQLAQLISAEAENIIWTSGATEANNLAIIGAAKAYQQQGKHVITMKTEHKAVLDTCKFLAGEGFEITYLSPQKNGLLNLTDFTKAIRSDTILVSIMHVNNETGVIQDIAAIGQICQQHKIIFHVDAAQSVAKLPIDMQQLPVDLLSISGHKFYAPKGIGALYVKRKPRVRLIPQIHGGGHEHGLRSGTLPVHQIVALGLAAEIATKELTNEIQRLQKLRNKFWQILKVLPDIYLNGSQEQTIPGIMNISFSGVDGSALLWALKDLAVATGSACTSADIASSHVLAALAVPDVLAHSTLRLSFGRFTTFAELEFAAKYIIEKVQWLRKMAPSLD